MARKNAAVHDPVPALEWAAAAAGLLLAVALIGIILRDALTFDDSAVPALTVEANRVVKAGAGYVVEFTARNASPATAAGVQVEGVLEVSGAEPETSSATIDYVPGRSRAKGGLLFQTLPAAQSLKLRVVGYEVP
jgi:uncharacterized protein (TIGR02588 family)